MNHVFAVHTMGRVGSRSLAYSLFGQGYACVHTHNFNGDINPYELTTKYLLESYDRFNSKLWVFSPVRDLVARNLSVYCHTDPNPTFEGFLRYPHTAPDTWIRKELKGYWGVDVFEEPFNKEKGWQWYNIPGAKATLVIYQLERLDEVWPQIWELVHINRKTPMIRRIGESHTPIYSKWRIPEEYLDKVYNGIASQTFYSESDLAAFRRSYES